MDRTGRRGLAGQQFIIDSQMPVDRRTQLEDGADVLPAPLSTAAPPVSLQQGLQSRREIISFHLGAEARGKAVRIHRAQDGEAMRRRFEE